VKKVYAHAVSSLYYYPDDEGSVVPVIADEESEGNRSAGGCDLLFSCGTLNDCALLSFGAFVRLTFFSTYVDSYQNQNEICPTELENFTNCLSYQSSDTNYEY
jgi:hypothetical protein